MLSESVISKSASTPKAKPRARKSRATICPEGYVNKVKENVLLGNGTACYRAVEVELNPELPVGCVYLRVVEYVAPVGLKKCYLTLEEYQSKSKKFANGQKVFKAGDTVSIIYSDVYERYIMGKPNMYSIMLQSGKLSAQSLVSMSLSGLSSFSFQLPGAVPSASSSLWLAMKKGEQQKQEQEEEQVLQEQEQQEPQKPQVPAVFPTLKANEALPPLLAEIPLPCAVKLENGTLAPTLPRQGPTQAQAQAQGPAQAILGAGEKSASAERGGDGAAESAFCKEPGNNGNEDTLAKKKPSEKPKAKLRQSRENKDWSNVWLVVRAKADGKVKLWQRNVELIGSVLANGVENYVPAKIVGAGYSYTLPRIFHKDGGPKRRCYLVEFSAQSRLWVDEDLINRRESCAADEGRDLFEPEFSMDCTEFDYCY